MLMLDVLINHVQKEICLFATHAADTLFFTTHSRCVTQQHTKYSFLQLAIYSQLFSPTASYSSPHSVIWLYGRVAVNRWGGIDGANLSCGVESTIFHTGCNNNLQSHLIELSHHIPPANISSSGFQMESRPKYYGREWVLLNCFHFLCLFFEHCWAETGFIHRYCLTSEVVMV